jgi:hypothetical protein
MDKYMKEIYDKFVMDSRNKFRGDDYACDVCGEGLYIPCYYLNNNIQICNNCPDEFWKMLEIIDRADKTIEEKPLIWPCIICDEKQGGGKNGIIIRIVIYVWNVIRQDL